MRVFQKRKEEGEGERGLASTEQTLRRSPTAHAQGTVIQERRFLEEKPAQQKNCTPGSGTGDEGGGMTLQLPPCLVRKKRRRGQHTSTTEQLYSEFTFAAVTAATEWRRLKRQASLSLSSRQTTAHTGASPAEDFPLLA